MLIWLVRVGRAHQLVSTCMAERSNRQQQGRVCSKLHSSGANTCCCTQLARLAASVYLVGTNSQARCHPGHFHTSDHSMWDTSSWHLPDLSFTYAAARVAKTKHPPKEHDPSKVPGVVKYGRSKHHLTERVQGDTDIVYFYKYGKDVGGYSYAVSHRDVGSGTEILDAKVFFLPVHGKCAGWWRTCML